MLGVGIARLVGTDISAVNAAAIGSETILKRAYPVDILADVWAGAITGGPTDVRDKVNATGLPAAMNTLEFAAPPPSEDPFLC